MISTLQYLGIYPDAIEKASETAEKALELCYLSDKINDLHEMAAHYINCSDSHFYIGKEEV